MSTADIEIDVVLQDEEDGEKICAELAQRFGVVARVSPEQYNSTCTIELTGRTDQLMRVRQWHNASHKPRPDLVGKRPVARGEKR